MRVLPRAIFHLSYGTLSHAAFTNQKGNNKVYASKLLFIAWTINYIHENWPLLNFQRFKLKKKNVSLRRFWCEGTFMRRLPAKKKKKTLLKYVLHSIYLFFFNTPKSYEILEWLAKEGKPNSIWSNFWAFWI